MDQVLRVMDDYGIKIGVRCLFVFAHSAIDPIETVRFRCRSRMSTLCNVHILELRGEALCHLYRRTVIGIDAEKEIVILIADCGYIVTDHIRNHSRLVPTWNKDRDAPLQFRLRQAIRLLLHSEGMPEAHHCRNQIVQTAK
jgi:hypothetical protein